MFEFYQTYLINNKRKKSLHNNETFMDLECKSSHKKNGQLKFTLSIVKVLEQIYYYSLDKIRRKSLSIIIHELQH